MKETIGKYDLGVMAEVRFRIENALEALHEAHSRDRCIETDRAIAELTFALTAWDDETP